MKKLILIFFTVINTNLYAQVINESETNFPSEGSINEGTWGCYLLNNDGASRTLRFGVSNDGYTRAEIELENNNTSSGKILFKTTNLNGGAVERMIIANDGKVGIGTSALTSKFNVFGQDIDFFSGTTENTLRIGRNNNENFGLYVTDNNGYIDYNQDADENGQHVLYIRNISGGSSTSNDIRIQTSGLDRLTIKSNGNIGIGTNNPKSKLSVNGTIISTEIKVLADISQYPDFVFSDKYKLRSLKEVENYIEENNHLPDIPTADDVTEGIALGEMNTRLLQKIEELTLYVIEQSKKTEQQNNIIGELKRLVELQNKKIEKLESALK